MAKIIAAIAVGLISPCQSSAFLEAKLVKEDVQQTLLSWMSEYGRGGSGQLTEIENKLAPMFATLPKTVDGTLERATVRYALHRYFVQEHGWYMGGLQGSTSTTNATAPLSIMKDRAPSYIQGLFEDHLHSGSLGLRELSIFAGTLTDLVHAEVQGDLLRIYSLLGVSTVGHPTENWQAWILKAYFITYLMGSTWAPPNFVEFQLVESELPSLYPHWADTYLWLQDFEQDHDFKNHQQNPFQSNSKPFDGMVSLVQDVGHNFGSFQNLECKMLKNRLLDLEHQGTGRVRMSRFYAGGLQGDWTFTESVDYLRNLGALDETVPGKPSVVITNYITSETNCLTTSGFYNVCCLDECEVLLRNLEKVIAASSAEPSRIAQLVSGMPSDTVDAPRNLSSALLSRLNDIANTHKGRVPLHGRLFAQWLHHAYPRECPFPNEAGTVNPMDPHQWMMERGLEDTGEEVETMRRWHESHDFDVADTTVDALPWTTVEELVAEDMEGAWSERSSKAFGYLRMVMAAAASMSFLMPLMNGVKVFFKHPAEEKAERLMV